MNVRKRTKKSSTTLKSKVDEKKTVLKETQNVNNITDTNNGMKVPKQLKRRNSSASEQLTKKSKTDSKADVSLDEKKENGKTRVNYFSYTFINKSLDEDHSKDLAVTDHQLIKKHSNVTKEAEFEAERQKQLEYLGQFVNIVSKYSTFLEQKIATAYPSSSSDQDDAEQPAIREDIMNRLKYFKGDLRTYQKEGVTWLTVLFENSVNGILGDEMGLGKTIQIIALICHLYERKVAGPFLIVVPLSTLSNWKREFEKFGPKIPVVSFHGMMDERKGLYKYVTKMYELDGRPVKPVVLTSYQMPLMEKGFLEKITWQYIIVDEGHRLKNPNSKLSIELRSLKSINRTLLTGTPLQNNTQELWALLHFLMPKLFVDPTWFAALLELDDIADRNKLLEAEAQSHLISSIHRTLSPFMLRREKKHVLPEMVMKEEVVIYCRLTELQKYLYRAVLRNDHDKLMMRKLNGPKESDTAEKRRGRKQQRFGIDQSTDELEKNIPTHNFVPNNQHVPIDCPDCAYMCYLTMQNPMMMVRKIVDHPYLVWCPLNPKSRQRQMYISEDMIQYSGKLQVLDVLLPKLKAQGHKVLIFSTFVMFLDIVEEMLLMRGHKYARLDGATKFEVRDENIAQFSTDEETFIFLLSTRAGGLGLNLTAADTVIFMDRDWNPMVDAQAQDRCHRIGQTKPVMVYSLITKGTIDELILGKGEVKRLLERIIIKEGKFQNLKKTFNENEVAELEEVLNKEEKCQHVHPNGLMYSEEDLMKVLDRSHMFKKLDSTQNQEKKLK